MQYDRLKNSKNDLLGLVPAHWEIKPIKYTCTPPAMGLWGDEPESEEDETVKCIRVADFNYSKFSVKRSIPTERKVSLNGDDRRWIHKGDLLLEKSGGGDKTKVGRVVRVTHDAVNTICSNFISILHPKDNYESRFLNYCHSFLYLKQANVKHIKQTTGIQNLDLASYLGEEFCFPPLQEQTAIANYLDEKTSQIDRLIDISQKKIERLQEYRTALINQVVTKGLDPSVPMKDIGIEWIGEIPEHWRVGKIKRVLQNLNYKRVPLSSEVRADMEKKYDYYGASGVIDKVNDYIFDEDLILIGEDGANLLMRSKQLAFIATGKYWVNNHAHILKPKSGNLYFYSYLLGTFDYTPLISGSAQPKLTSDALMNFEIYAPPINEQEEMVSFLDSKCRYIKKEIDTENNRIQKLQEYRQTLISEVVTGKKKVVNTEVYESVKE